MKNLFVCLIVGVIVFLSFCIPNILFKIEDLNTEMVSYKKEKVVNRINVEAENIYLVKAIHDIQDGNLNLNLKSMAKSVNAVESQKTVEDEGKFEADIRKELGKMSEAKVLNNMIANNKKIEIDYKMNEREYINYEKTYKIIQVKIILSQSEYMLIEIEEKTGKIIYISSNSDMIKDIDKEEILRNYIKYLDLYIIDDWPFENNVLISEKAELIVSIVSYEDMHILSVCSTSNSKIKEYLKLIN